MACPGSGGQASQSKEPGRKVDGRREEPESEWEVGKGVGRGEARPRILRRRVDPKYGVVYLTG